MHYRTTSHNASHTGKHDVQGADDVGASIRNASYHLTQTLHRNTGHLRSEHHEFFTLDIEDRTQEVRGLANSRRLGEGNDYPRGQPAQQVRLYVQQKGDVFCRGGIGVAVDIELGHQKVLSPLLKTPSRST